MEQSVEDYKVFSSFITCKDLNSTFGHLNLLTATSRTKLPECSFSKLAVCLQQHQLMLFQMCLLASETGKLSK